tara:strand:+ start:5131 stop:5391 length:261 start_codon:yes stop_codon:yes gene_type:complete
MVYINKKIINKSDQSSKESKNMLQAFSTASRFFLNAVQSNPDAHPVQMLKDMRLQGWFNQSDLDSIIREMKSVDLNIPKSEFRKVH